MLTAQLANVVCAVLAIYAIVVVAHPRLRVNPWAHGFAAYLALLASFCYMVAAKYFDKPQLLGVAMFTTAVGVGYIIAGMIAFNVRKIH
jgi:hypothetical protein